ncbi:methyltransferase domain-containing protein [Devosia algicola]|uniref:Methyltransferase domain-containing protein n=1 Tax=Devosia algicola TaxID=3026418 RepID=A0ABY7YMB7_9HYPH|nr:methyltransferase domain-containing protein [Devosia algicola]WDR02352.1 methyltransferase domain-containing protein [Devosia algicola]
MNSPDPTLDRYLNGDYAEKNPDWDSADAPWKAGKIAQILADHAVVPQSVVEVGCGSGAVLVGLQKMLPNARMEGYDIAPDAQRFWGEPSHLGIHFGLGDYLEMDTPVPDVVLVVDVLEHLGNPWDFLSRLRSRSKLIVCHIPLDLSASSVVRETPLLHVRDKVGHLHYFTKQLAVLLLEESGYEVLEARYTNASLDAPQLALRTRMFGWLRRLLCALNKDFGVRMLGGETLMVIARPLGDI